VTSTDPGPDGTPSEVPRVPASASALIFDASGRLLILKPTYKGKWTLPGGQVEADGETPWEACRREVQEETGLALATGRLVCVDFLRPRPGKPGGIRFLFHCGTLGDDELASITLQEEELSEHRVEDVDRALELLSRPVRRRVRRALEARTITYLEDGRPIDARSRGPGRHGRAADAG